MTINPRAIRALRDARTRLRDIAAAEHGEATGARERVALRLATEREALTTRLDEASTELAEARTIHQLVLVAALVDEHHDAIATTIRAHADASGHADHAAGRLRQRTRELRTAEKLVEISKQERDTSEAKAEQRSADDRHGARR